MTKSLFLAVLIGLALFSSASAQPTNLYENDGNVIVPPQIAPQIDATNFVNKGLFDINLPINITQTGEQITYYETWDTLNYSNRNTMTGSTGYRFDNFAGGPGGNGLRKAAAIFANTGTITAGLHTNSNLISQFTGYLGTAQIIANATNLTNSGLMEVGADGFISLGGNNVNLSRGTLQVENILATNLLEFAQPNAGIFNQSWGTGVSFTNFLYDGTNAFGPTVNAINAVSSNAIVQVVASNAMTFANSIGVISPVFNNVTQVIFVQNVNPGFSVDVRFVPVVQFVTNNGLPVNIHFQGVSTNRLGIISTNDLYLTDNFAQNGWNPFLIPSGFYGVPPFTIIPTFSPDNYIINTNFTNFDSLPPGNTAFNTALLGTNYKFLPPTYAVYNVSLSPLTAGTVTNLPGSTISNLPGRIQITASNVLDLTRTIIKGPNYLTISSTNHYVGSTNAQIVSPYYDINLASTNGILSISNLVAPVVPHLCGTLGVWSGGYVFSNAFTTNLISVVIINNDLTNVSPVTVQNLRLSSTNVSISDRINVTNVALINAVSLTTTSNDIFSPTDGGELNLISPQIIWSGITPRLSYITNNGGITTMNSVYFAGTRQPPYYSTSFTEPYQTFINHGFVWVAGATVWANYFENSGFTNNIVLGTNAIGTVTNQGTFTSYIGPFTLQASTALLSNALIQATSDLSLSSGTLVVTNHALRTTGALTLSVTNFMTDDVTNLSTDTGNYWQCAFGMNLPIKPATGDLLGTTITNTCAPNIEVPILWAGEDRGPNVTGFLNNAAVGHLVLDGGDTGSAFIFGGPGPQNAIYVDMIELKDGATNRISTVVNGQVVQTYTAVDVSPGMTLYYADAMAGGQDISEKLNGNVTASGGQVVWVSSYAGLFSSTNITYPSGVTYTLNRALVQSTDIDSNNNGTNNAFDPAPVYVPENARLTLSFTNAPAKSAVISWQTLAGATNSLFTSTDLTGVNWVLATNFVKNVNGLVSYTNSLPDNGPRYYKVRVDLPQP